MIRIKPVHPSRNPPKNSSISLYVHADSSGVSALLDGARQLASQGHALKATDIPGEIRESMELIGFFQVMEALFPAEDTE